MIRPIKIAVVMPLATQRGGGELMLTHAVTFAKESAIHWLIIFLELGPMVEQFRAIGVDSVVIPAGRLRQPLRFVKTIMAIARIARRERISGICGWMAKGHFYGSLAATIAGIPSFWYQLGVYNASLTMDRWAVRLPSNGIVTLSKAGFEAQTRVAPKTPIRLVYPGVDLNRFNVEEMPSISETRRRLRLPRNVPIVGIAGRLQRWKGMHTLISAMAIILREIPAVVCVIVGGEHDLEPEYPRHLAELVRELRIEDQVAIVGFQTNVNEWLHAMDVVVHASDNEPFGIVVIEAMALGKPVVAGSRGGPAEIITDGVDGLLAPFDDSTALADCVLRFLRDPTYAANVGKRARERACRFTIEAYASNLTDAFQDLVIGARKRPAA